MNQVRQRTLSLLKTYLRTLQTRFPWSIEAKFAAQRSWRRLRRRPFDPDFQLLARFRPEPGQVLVDIGCNRGQSVDAIRLYHPGAAIVAFEPNPLLVEKLRRLFRTDSALRVEAFGLGAEEGEFELHVPYYNGWMFDGLASIDRHAAASWLNADRIMGFVPERLQIKSSRCFVRRLDSFELKPWFIKIDVQGLEKDVIMGGMTTIAKYRPIVLVESEDYDDIDSLLAPLGYRPATMTEGDIEFGLRRANNVFYLTSEHMEKIQLRRPSAA